jgi:hypothetical protein
MQVWIGPKPKCVKGRYFGHRRVRGMHVIFYLKVLYIQFNFSMPNGIRWR